MTAAPAAEIEVGNNRSLEEWLRWQKSLHPHAIELGLQRVREVAVQLGLLPFSSTVITVGGTNGKGSCALTLGHILRHQGRTGVYTSPHLRRYNERIRIAGEQVSDADLCTAFAAVAAARKDVSLTYFEFGTLAALWLFRAAKVDFAVLEVGMGGRLDAVNIVDADVALITNIGLDHTQWLGDNREAIGYEKAGILRPAQAGVCTDRDPPASVLQRARTQGTELQLIGRDFELAEHGGTWQWTDWKGHTAQFVVSEGMLRDNFAAVLAVLTCLDRLPEPATLTQQMADCVIPGRRQLRPGQPCILLDVAHNTEAMRVLAQWLAAHPIAGHNHLLVGMLEDKPVELASAQLLGVAEHVHAVGLPGIDRGLQADELASRLAMDCAAHVDVAAGLNAVLQQAGRDDRIIICGSFHTVNAALEVLDG